MQKIGRYSILIVAVVCAVGLVSCKDELAQELTGSILGTVADATTGEPVPTVNVSLEPGGKSALTGSDGNYLFSDLEVGSYTVSISKQGYTPDSRVIEVEPDKSANGDFLIERIPAVVTVDRDTLDFGDGSDVNSLSFNIVNSSYEDLEWNIEYSCSWITEVRDTAGILPYSKTQAIVVFIDRELLSAGENTTVVVVRSSNGSSDLVVKAVGAERAEVVLNTLEVEDVTSSTATLYGEVINPGVPRYTARGFVYSTSSKPTEATAIETLTAPVTDDDIYSARVTGLELGQQYYVRAFAKSDLGTFYSTNEEIFTANGTGPQVKVLDVSNIDLENMTATFNAAVENAGDPEYSSRGFVYGTYSNPTIENNFLSVSGIGNGVYSTKVKDLDLNTKYYVRACAENALGTYYSDNEVSFTTEGEDPVVSVQEVSNVNVSNKSVLLNGTVEYSGAPSYIEKGFVYGFYPNPSISDSKVAVSGTNVGLYSAQISDLVLDRQYYVKAYAIGFDGKTVVYSSEEVSFTISIIPPEVSVLEITDIDINKAQAVFNGNILNVGDPAYTEKGFVYGPVSSPLVCEDKVMVEGSGSASYSVMVTGLGYDISYNVWAYAVNSKGVTYSKESMSFIMESELPQVKTENATNVDYESGSATLNGIIISEGLPAYTECGFVYSTINKSPTVDDTKLVYSGTIENTYSLHVDGKFPKNAWIFIRAYAASSVGVSYGKTTVIGPPFVELSSVGIAVQSEDIGHGSWDSVNYMCENSELGGYSDWRLPTIDELYVMYNTRETVGMFIDKYYWSSTQKENEPDSHYYLEFDTGNIDYEMFFYTYNLYGRCVRTLE